MKGYTDIHTHILPGVDDGAKTVAESLQLIQLAYQNGTRTIILTPHYRGKYKRDPAWLKEVFGLFRKLVAQHYPDMNLYLGSEVYYEQETPDLLEAGRAMTINDSQYCLLEFQPVTLRSQIMTGVSETLRYGFTPIIAHIERYDACRKDRSFVDELLDMGALIQINADSVMGKHGLNVTHFCEKLLKEHKVHFIASDAHNADSRPPLLRECWWKVYKKYGFEYSSQLFYENAQAVIEDKII